MKNTLLLVAICLCSIATPAFAEKLDCEVHWRPTPPDFIQKASAQYKAFADVPVIAVPKAVFSQQPVYPLDAALGKVGGAVRAIALVNKRGLVTKVKIIESSPQKVFEQTTISAFEEWKFSKQERDGKPVEYIVDYVFVFIPGK